MLVLTRKPGEAIQIGHDVQVCVREAAGEMWIAATVSSPDDVAWASAHEVRIGVDLRVFVVASLPHALRLGVEAPRKMPVFRKEAYDELAVERQREERERPRKTTDRPEPPAANLVPHVVALAEDEARKLKHNDIGTEHILLGLLREENGIAARVLEWLDVTIGRVRGQVVRIVGSGEEITPGRIPYTPSAKRVLEGALGEAHSLGHNYIDTEHILLSLVRENVGVAMDVLLDFDADAEKIRTEVMRLL